MKTSVLVEQRKRIIEAGGWLWDKNLTSARSGNLSVRCGEGILITATSTSLGFLTDDDVVYVGPDGELGPQGAQPSTEYPLHRRVYESIEGCQAIIHAHTVYANAYFLRWKELAPQILESKYVLGDVPVVDQSTLTVEDAGPVVHALARNPIVHLRRHGSIVIGQDLFECFMRLQSLEYAAHVELLVRRDG